MFIDQPQPQRFPKHHPTLYKASSAKPISTFSSSPSSSTSELPPTSTSTSTTTSSISKFLSDRYDILDLVGVGGSAHVYSATDKLTMKQVCIKVIKKSSIQKERLVYDTLDINSPPLLSSSCSGPSNSQLVILPMEVYVLRRIIHPCILTYLNCQCDSENFYLITEHFGNVWSDPVSFIGNSNSSNQDIHDHSSNVQSSDLLEYLHVHGRLSEQLAKHIIYNLIHTCLYLKSINVFHCDIKAENILIDSNFNMKLIDFGSAWIIPSYSPQCSTSIKPRLFDRFYGTSSYAPPEVIMGRKYRADHAEVWSIGILLYTLICMSAPFSSVDHVLYHPYIHPEFELSADCHSFLDGVLRKDPMNRLTLEDLVCHPFLNL